MTGFTLIFVGISILFGSIVCQTMYDPDSVKFFTVPMHEVSESDIYLGFSEYGEMVVTYAGKGSDLRPDDYITHADGVRMLSGGLTEFIKSGQREAMVPIVNDDDTQFGGAKLLGFVRIQTLVPRKINARRGEIPFDFDEGGPAPTLQVGNVIIGKGGAKSTTDIDYVPPPNGGGKCITGRDCFNYNGTCPGGECKCIAPFTGTYCQVVFTTLDKRTPLSPACC